jgi:hypothetical protein
VLGQRHDAAGERQHADRPQQQRQISVIGHGTGEAIAVPNRPISPQIEIRRRIPSIPIAALARTARIVDGASEVYDTVLACILRDHGRDFAVSAGNRF